MVYIVINTKGGVGKSTVSMHLLTAYLHSKNGGKAIDYFEIDDQNKNIEGYSSSKIVSAQIIGSDRIASFITEAVIRDDDVIIDVGGNRTAADTLKELCDIGGFYSNACYFIPLLESKQDAINAENTLKLIREFDTENKVFFVLNKAINARDEELLKDQFMFFYGDIDLGINAFGADDNCAHFALDTSTVYNKLSVFGKTVVEMSKEDMTARIKAAMKEKDLQARRLAMKTQQIVKKSQNIVEKEYPYVFKTIDSFINYSTVRGDE